MGIHGGILDTGIHYIYGLQRDIGIQGYIIIYWLKGDTGEYRDTYMGYRGMYGYSDTYMGYMGYIYWLQG